MEGADVRRAVAEEGDAHRTGPEVLRTERGTGGEGEMRADDGERAERADGEVGEMHRAPLAAAQALRLAEDLRHRPVERRAHREHRAVTAVRARHRVARAERGACADRHGLLPLAEVRAAADEVQHEEPHHLVLEAADLEHPSLQVEEELPVTGQNRDAYRLVPTVVFII